MMDKQTYQKAYRLVRAELRANTSDLDYQVATCQYRPECGEGIYQTCMCDADANEYEFRQKAIRETRPYLTLVQIQIAADCYLANKRLSDKQWSLDKLQWRLQIARANKLCAIAK